ncbi:MAG: GGDEF domain-containing protein [Alphaproteobacteria bacterium]|nr:GGDEF domain-containing protein [Alphaproteobacteria bacterium]
MELDNRTLLLVVTFSSAVQTAAMFYVWRMQLRERSVALLTIGFALITVGTVLIAMRPALPPILTVVVGNAMVIGGQALCALAICEFTGRSVPMSYPIWLAGFTAAILAIFTFASPNIGIRIVVVSILIPLSLLPAILALCSTPAGALRRTHWPVAGVLVFHCVFALARSTATAIGGTPGDFFASNLITAAWFLESFAAINLTALGLILMISQRLQIELDRQASYDGLTGALNRRAFERVADGEWSRAVRHDLALSVLVLNLDRFKALNDTYGHDAGDIWLKSFAELTRGLLRREDLLCRYGGEEFIALLPQTPVQAAIQVADRIRRSVEGMRISHNGRDIAVTVSIGVATWNETVTDLKSMIAAADRALYRAKAAGRNRVESSEGN